MDHFDLVLRINLRHATRDDLAKLEWYGLMTPYRDVMLEGFLRAEAGEIIYLVADHKSFPVGQVQIDLTRHVDKNIAIIWALRVLSVLQNLGIGTRLIQTAETLIQARGFTIAEISVAKDNPKAKQLYERLGYQVVSEHVSQWSYTTPAGEVRHVTDEEWILRKPVG